MLRNEKQFRKMLDKKRKLDICDKYCEIAFDSLELLNTALRETQSKGEYNVFYKEHLERAISHLNCIKLFIIDKGEHLQ